MAGVNRAASIGEQVRLIAGLRWRMHRNALRRREARLEFLGMILGAAFAALFAAWVAVAQAAKMQSPSRARFRYVLPGFCARAQKPNLKGIREPLWD